MLNPETQTTDENRREALWGGIKPTDISDLEHTKQIQEKLPPLEESDFRIDNFLKLATKITEAIGGNEKIDIRGVENIPEEGGFVVAFSHAETFEPDITKNPGFWLSGIYRGVEKVRGTKIKTGIISTSRFDQNHFLKKSIMSLSGGIFVDPKSIKMNKLSIEKGIDILNNDGVVAISPEGKRENALVKGKRGVGKLAYGSNSPIVPVAYYADLAGKHVFFGEVIEPKKLDYQSLPDDEKRLLEYEISDKTMYAIADLLPERYRGYYK